MRLNLICIMKFNASCFALLVYLQKTLYFLDFHRDIGLKTGKHEFTDRIHQNKQGLEGKKPSGKEFLAFKDYQRVCVEDMAGSANCTQRFLYYFLTSIFASYPPESFKIICFTCIWSQFVYTCFHSSQNPQQNPRRISRSQDLTKFKVNHYHKHF